MLVLSAGMLAPSVSHANTNKSQNQVQCIATAIYHESRGQSEQCQGMVADVIINRTKNRHFPSTPCDVVYQKGQFAWVGKGYPINDMKSYERATRIARAKLSNHVDQTKGSLFFTTGKRLGPVRLKCEGHVFMGLVEKGKPA